MRRFLPLGLILCWALACLWPASRAELKRDWNARAFVADENSYRGTNEGSSEDIFGVSDDELRRRFPNDLDVQVRLAGSRFGGEAERVRALKPLMREHPREAWLLGLWLQARVATLHSHRNDGPLTNPNFPKPPSKETKPASTKAQWEELIREARRGSKLDPNNSYFDWFTLTGLLALRRDDEALRVLKLASCKTAFDEYSREETASRVRLHFKLNGFCDAGTRVNLFWGGVPYGHYSKFRQSARWMSENAIQSREAGNGRRALEWSLHALRLGRTMRTRSQWIISSLVGSAIQGLSYRTLRRVPGQKPPLVLPNRASVARFRAHKPYSSYLARSLGDARAAQEIEREWVAGGAWQKGFSRYLNGNRAPDFSPSLPGTLLSPLVWNLRARSLLLHALPLLLVLWLVSAWWLRRRKINALQSVDEIPNRRAAVWGAGVGTGVWLMLVAGDIALGHSQSENISGPLNWNWNAWWQGVLSSIGVVQTLPLWAFGAVGITLSCGALWRARRERDALDNLPKISLWQQIARGDALGLTRFDLAPLVGLIGRGSAWLASAALVSWIWILAFNAPDETLQEFYDSMRQIGIGVFWTLAGCGLLLQILAWRRTKRAGMFDDWMRGLRPTARGAWLALTLIYVVLRAVEVPLQTRFERGWNVTLAQGELQAAREIAGF